MTATRRQAGCVRFSYVPVPESQTPKRYRCQPDLALADVPTSEQSLVRQRLRPSYTSVLYGAPGYAQLGLYCPDEIATGAQDGSEMGAFCHLRQPQRKANLQLRLEEYLRVGLEAGIFFAS